MASIKGISLQNYHDWETPRGIAYRADLFVDGKKVGELYHEGNGGCPNAHVKNTVSQELSKRIAQYFKERPSAYATEESFWEELLQLGEWQEVYEKQKKEKGNTVLIVVHKSSRTDEGLVDGMDDLLPELHTLPDKRYTPLFLQKKRVLYRDIFESLADFEWYPVTNKRIQPDTLYSQHVTVAEMKDGQEYTIKGEETIDFVTLQKKEDTVLATFTFHECMDDQTVVYPLSVIDAVADFGLEVYVNKKPEQEYTLSDLYVTALSLYDGYMDQNYSFPESFQAKIKVYQRGELA